MKTIVIDKKNVEDIKLGKISHIILDKNIEDTKTLCLNYDIQVEITDKYIYKNIEECFKVIPMDLFGIASVEEAKDKYNNYGKLYVYRVKYDNNMIEDIIDSELLKIINISTLEKNNIGHSNINVYEVELNDGRKGILKVQHLSNRNDLHDEYERIDWLRDKCNVPKIYYYNELNNVKYLLMEKLSGIPAFKLDNIAFDIGKLLKKIHSIDIKECSFKQNSIEVLTKKVLENIDIIVDQVRENYPEMSKADIVDFIKNNAPQDQVLVHGDYSLPNIIVNDSGDIGVIDLGDVSVSSMYYDFYYLRKSMIRNKKIEQFDELLRGYGIEKLDEKYMKWIEIVDKVLF